MVHLLIMLCEIKKINYFLENTCRCPLCLQSQTSNFTCDKTIGFVQSKIRRWTLTLDSFHIEISWLFILPTLNKAVLQKNRIKEGLRFAFKYVFKEGRVFIVIRPLFCSRKQCATQSLTCRLAWLLATSIRAKTRGWRGGSRIEPRKTGQ